VSAEGPVQGMVYVVDDEPEVRASISLLLRSVAIGAATFPDAPAFLAAYRLGTAPSCLLLDLRMPGMCGLELFGLLKQRGAALPVVMVTAHGDVGVAVRAMKAGVFDFVEKPFRGNDLIDTVHHALRQAAASMERAAALARTRARLDSLTPRESEVLNFVAQGATSKAIARRLDLSVRTIELYRARIMEKTCARTLTDLVRMTLQAETAANA
jgi:two-component system response regulator FixJ